MKLSSLLVLAAVSGSATAFAPACGRSPTVVSSLNMFGGAGAGMPSEDNPEELKKMEEAAKAMGMSVDEYKLGMGARMRLMEEVDNARVTGGTADVKIERDGNNPPKFLDIKITDAGKGLGKEGLSDALVKGLKQASDASRTTRMEAQKKMMGYISGEMKKLGK